MAEPTCDKCGAQGAENIMIKHSGVQIEMELGVSRTAIFIIYCSSCGHIYSTQQYLRQNGDEAGRLSTVER